MALQIAPIKPSRRKILPNLNKAAYTEKSRRTEKVGSKRSRLVNPQSARKIAGQKTRRQLERGDYGVSVVDYKRGEKLKDGIEALARKAEDVTAEQRAKLSMMDPAKLDAMYQNNDLIFEVFFQYNQSSDGIKMLNQKNSDVQFLINQYEKIYGALSA